MERIKPRKKTKETLYEMERTNEINSILNNCFEKKSLSEKDYDILFNWACDNVLLGYSKERLTYLLEKKKMEILK